MKYAIAYIDGSGNSGGIEACAVTLDISGVCHEKTRLLPPSTTNNVGEYSGLLLCLRFAKQLGVEVLLVRSDSLLIVNQTLGKWRCKDAYLQKLLDQVRQESKGFHSLSIEWVPREKNKRADALCRKAQKAARVNIQNRRAWAWA